MLVDRLVAAPTVPVVCVVAPAGYGKSTLLALVCLGLGVMRRDRRRKERRQARWD